MKLRKLISGMMSCMNALAMLLVMQTANSACIWIAHQPALPEEAKSRFGKY